MAIPVAFSINKQGLEVLEELLEERKERFGDEAKRSHVIADALQYLAECKVAELVDTEPTASRAISTKLEAWYASKGASRGKLG
jgi:hypothetical protein